MSLLDTVAAFSNDQSVAAFMGAFAAFSLVVVNDWRRNGQKVKNIAGEIQVNLSHAESKLERVRYNRTMVRAHNTVLDGPFIRFGTPTIRQLTAEVLSRLSSDQRGAIDAVCFGLEQADNILDEIYSLARNLSVPLGHAQNVVITNKLLAGYESAIVQLNFTREMCGNYLAGDYKTVLTKKYARAQYEEPWVPPEGAAPARAPGSSD